MKKLVLVFLLLLGTAAYAGSTMEMNIESWYEEARPVGVQRQLDNWNGPKTIYFCTSLTTDIFKHCDHITDDMGTLNFRAGGKEYTLHGSWIIVEEDKK